MTHASNDSSEENRITGHEAAKQNSPFYAHRNQIKIHERISSLTEQLRNRLSYKAVWFLVESVDMLKNIYGNKFLLVCQNHGTDVLRCRNFVAKFYGRINRTRP